LATQTQPKSIGVYAGSFDPPTHGHIWMIREGAKLFDRLIVAVGVNPDKRATFGVQQRVELLEAIVADITADLRREGRPAGRISVSSYQNQFLVQFAASVGATAVLRGIRNEADYAYERTMRHINADLQAGITTVFLIPPRNLVEVSSSSVKAMIGPDGWRSVVSSFVPPAVFKALEAWHVEQVLGAKKQAGRDSTAAD